MEKIDIQKLHKTKWKVEEGKGALDQRKMIC